MRFLIVSIFISTYLFAQATPFSTSRYEKLTGIKADNNAKEEWDKKYSSSKYVFGKAPAKFLAKNYDYIPKGATVLDIGMGEGRNAVFLAQKGYKVTGIDISSVAIKKAKLLAREFGVRIHTIQASAADYKFKPKSFDAIVCYYFIDRDLNKKIQSWLKPGGILFYEAYTDRQRQVKGYKRFNKNWLLRNSELLHMFPRMQVLKYEEPLNEKDFRASLIARKK